jgi:hypothetical protein
MKMVTETFSTEVGGVFFGGFAALRPVQETGDFPTAERLAETEVPRDIAGWSPAVVLEVGETAARAPSGRSARGCARTRSSRATSARCSARCSW